MNETLKSILTQYKKNKVKVKDIELIILDNASTDETKKIVEKYQRKINLRYYRNSKNIGLIRNIIKVGTYARGEYIWFFSDDDVQTYNAINKVMGVIKKNKPDAILCNLDERTKDLKKLKHPNSLGVKNDKFFSNRKQLFSHLSTQFFYNVDWYTTFYSILVMRKELFGVTRKLAALKENSNYFFPHYLGIYTSGKDLKIYIISKILVHRRSENTTWEPKEKRTFAQHWDITLTDHYKRIVNANKDAVPLQFKINLFLKRVIRLVRLYILLPIFRY